MIPKANVTQWRAKAPWPADEQVEQDLILSRILIEIFSDPILNKELAFRGGTALHKLFFNPPGRYSEDIDLVRTNTGPIGEIINVLRNKLSSWLGEPSTKRNEGRFTLYYKFQATTATTPTMRVKIEINTRENEALFGLQQQKFTIENSWFSGETDIRTYQLEELLGTKLRALYQRKKGRDLFDLFLALKCFQKLNVEKLIAAFDFYLAKEEKQITRAQFEKNLFDKLQDNHFAEDIMLLLNREISAEYFDIKNVVNSVYKKLIVKLSGEPWKRQDELSKLLNAM